METTSLHYYIPVLSIAGSDPSGGAGIQQDIKTCEAFGCYGMAAVTALTAQSYSKITSILNTSHYLEAQLYALLDEMRPYAVKVGMLPDAESVEIIVNAIKRYRLVNIVVDPVINSSSGHVLAQAAAVEAMKEMLFPLATVLTPNIPEAEALTGRNIVTVDEVKEVAKVLSENYICQAVLVKGGHSESGEDVLFDSNTNRIYTFLTKRIYTPNTHGTGCRLSTAIACGLAKGLDVIEAVMSAKDWLMEDLRKNACRRFPKALYL